MVIENSINVFFKIIEPAIKLIDKTQENLEGDSETFTLYFKAFTINLIYGIINQIKSISMLVIDIKTSVTAKEIGLTIASKSMYSESFDRYDPEIFRKIFGLLLLSCNLMAIPEINILGKILLVDGSIFPAISSMQWASYKESANAIKLQLSFELNRMIPVQFICTEGNFSEKKFLINIIEKGSTYICDRGYISFDLFFRICEAGANFIIRGKSNLIYIVNENLEVNIPVEILYLMDNIKDIIFIFNGDINNKKYRIVKFNAIGEEYILITNRFDLTTHEVIMLYAYRWQIELCFRFIKRTLNGIHLMSHSKNGIQIQFYLYMIVSILLLMFKQKCELTKTNNIVEKSQPASIKKMLPNSGRFFSCGLVTMLGEKLKRYWKIGIHWLTVVKNLLTKTYGEDVIKILAGYT